MKFQGKITGDKTHEIGYRVFLLRKAMEMGIERFNALNTYKEDKQVVIFYNESDLETADEYEKYINVNFPQKAIVSEILFNEYNGYIISVIDYMHLIQVEQLSKGIPAILSIDNKQDKMLEKQDTTIEVLKSVKEDTSTIKDEISTSKEDINRLSQNSRHMYK